MRPEPSVVEETLVPVPTAVGNPFHLSEHKEAFLLFATCGLQNESVVVFKLAQDEGVVVVKGKGSLNEKGELIPLSVKSGDRVLLPECGGTKVLVDQREYFLYHKSELHGVE